MCPTGLQLGLLGVSCGSPRNRSTLRRNPPGLFCTTLAAQGICFSYDQFGLTIGKPHPFLPQARLEIPSRLSIKVNPNPREQNGSKRPTFTTRPYNPSPDTQGVSLHLRRHTPALQPLTEPSHGSLALVPLHPRRTSPPTCPPPTVFGSRDVVACSARGAAGSPRWGPGVALGGCDCGRRQPICSRGRKSQAGGGVWADCLSAGGAAGLLPRPDSGRGPPWIVKIC